MARKVVKVENHNSKIGMLMTAVAAIGAFSLFKNRRRQTSLVEKLAKTTAALVAAKELLGERAAAHANARSNRFATWLAR